MLPERLSNGVCSLKPDVNRLTHSVFIRIHQRRPHEELPLRPNGHPQRAPSDLPRGLRHSARRRPNDQLGERLHVAWELASLLRRKRFEQGSLDLDFPEVKVRLDEQGKPILARADRERRIAPVGRGIHARGERSRRARAQEPLDPRRSTASTKIPSRTSWPNIASWC